MRRKDNDFEFYKKRSEAFEMEVKNLLQITIPDIDLSTADYLAKRIDITRLNYERAILNKFEKNLDNR